MGKVFLKTKLTNQLKAKANEYGIELEFHLKNISINGDKRGCSGHVVNKANGVCVYINTEGSVLSSLDGKSMYRLAADIRDYSSNGLRNGNNRWSMHTALADNVIEVLMKEHPEPRA